MYGHAVLLPGDALVHAAGEGVGLVVVQRGPGEAAQGGVDQADVGPPAVVHGHQVDHVGVGAAHQAAVPSILAVGPRELVGRRELAVHAQVLLQVGDARVHLGPAGREQEGRGRAHWRTHTHARTHTHTYTHVTPAIPDASCTSPNAPIKLQIISNIT